MRSYVVRTLDRSELYDGRIGDVRLHLWRGAYSIDDVRIVKTTGNVPVPFFSAERVDLALEWGSLLHGEFVGRLLMERPELNFVDAADESEDQTGAGGPWLEIIRDLFPFKINSAEVEDGTIHFRAFETTPPVDVYLSKVEGTITNLTNIHEDVTPMFTTVRARALAMDQAKVEYVMTLDPLAYRPTFHAAARLLGLDVTKTNDLARAYGRFDFEHGWLDLVVEIEAREGRVEGYVKPIFRDVRVLDLRNDVTDVNVLRLFWEALVGGGAELFKNRPRDQVATVIPFTGDLTDPRADVLAAIGNVLRNAFVRAYLPKLQGTAPGRGGLSFGPASLPEFGPSSLLK